MAVKYYNYTDLKKFGEHIAEWVQKGMLIPDLQGKINVTNADIENWEVGVNNSKLKDSALKDAELLIMQLPVTDSNRQNWLIKNGVGLESEELRKRKRIREVHQVILNEKPQAKWVSWDGYFNTFSAETSIGVFLFEKPRTPNEDPEPFIDAVLLLEFLKF